MAVKLKTAVLGATGYSGLELARLLACHSRTEPPLLLRRSAETDDPAAVLPPFSGDNGHSMFQPRSQPFSWLALEQHGVQLLFLATPHAVSRELVPEAMARGLRVIDLSGAWRLKQEQNRAVYGFKDTNPETAMQVTERAVYGLPEINGDKIPGAALVANPGCYPTSVILALAPLLLAGMVDCRRGVICDSKSGVSGAGKEPTARTHFVSVADNFFRVLFFRPSSHWGNSGAIGAGSWPVDFHSPSAAHSARNSFHNLCLSKTEDDGGRDSNLF